MALIDYGAILKVDGKIINHDLLMMDESDTGYYLSHAKCADTPIRVAGNFFAIAGDEDLLLAFYKTQCYVIKKGIVDKIIFASYDTVEHFTTSTESTINDNIKVRYLDKALSIGNLTRRYKFKYYKNGKCYIKQGYADVPSRRAPSLWRHKNFRFYAEWEHNAHHYEVVYGYGIDPNYKIYRETRKCYDYTPKEILFIEEFYKDEYR